MRRGRTRISTIISQAGTYRVERDKVIHRVELSGFQNEVGDMLQLDTVPLMRDGRQQVFRLILDRLPDD